MSTLTFVVRTTKIGRSQVAATTVAGVMIRGARAETELGAIMNLFGRGMGSDDAQLAIEMALEGTDLESLAPQENTQAKLPTFVPSVDADEDD